MDISLLPQLERMRVAMTIPVSLIWKERDEVRATSIFPYLEIESVATTIP
jgi:hypothetical protein